MSGIYFGTSNNTGERFSLPISQFGKTHFHVLGATQVGKTHFLERIGRDIIKAGYGLLCLDGKGELYDKLLHFLAITRYPTHKLYLIDPRDNYSVGVNVLERMGKTDSVTQASLVIDAIQKMHADQEVRQLLEEWGRAILIPLCEANLSITEIFPFITDKQFRRAVLTHESDSLILGKWNTYDTYSPTRQAQLTEVVQRRFEIFRLSPFLRGMFGQLTTTLPWSNILNRKQIVLGQLAYGVDEKALSFMGTSLINQIKRASYLRTKASPLFFVLLDEFQRFLTPDMDTALAQLSGLNVSFILAHQNMEQLRAESSSIYHAVRNNCRAKAVFSCSDHDAAIMARDGLGDREVIREQEDRHYRLKIKHYPPLSLITPTVKDTSVAPAQLTRYKHKVYERTAKHIDHVKCEVEQRALQYTSPSDRASRIESAIVAEQKPIEDFTAPTVVREHREPRKERVTPEQQKQLSYEQRRFLEHISQHPGLFVTKIYQALGLSGYKGDRVKQALIGEGLITQDDTRKGAGGRVAKTISLTDMGHQVLEGLVLPGKGSNLHKELQDKIKEQAESLGWKAKVEERIEGTAEAVDVGLEKDHIKVAVEISVSTDHHNEIKNIQKCLAAGYDYVICAVSDEKTLQTLTTKGRRIFSFEERKRIRYGRPSDVKAFLEKIMDECLVSEKNKANSQDRNQKQLWGVDEAAQYVGVPAGTIYTWRSQNKIPYLKVGRLVKFDPDELKKWLEQKKVSERELRHQDDV